jgi:hypothetical protein
LAFALLSSFLGATLEVADVCFFATGAGADFFTGATALLVGFDGVLVVALDAVLAGLDLVFAVFLAAAFIFFFELDFAVAMTTPLILFVSNNKILP